MGSIPTSGTEFAKGKFVPSSYSFYIYAARGKIDIMWHVYILKCTDSSLYTGISADVITRVLTHNKGKGSKYTRSRKPVELIYTEEFKTKSEALKREIEIKKLSAKNKNRLAKHGLGDKFPSVHSI